MTTSVKGGVENLIYYVKRNYLTPVPQCKSLKELNARLLEKCCLKSLNKTAGQEQTIGELFAEEKDWLLPLQTPYENYKTIDTKVSGYQTVQIDKNYYSTPSKNVEQKVIVELGLSTLRITHKNKVIAEHQRDYGKDQWILNPWHYMQLLRQKSRSFKTSRILTTMEEQWDPVVLELWKRQMSKYGEHEGTKEFLDTLLFFKGKEYSDMVAVIELALESKVHCKDSIYLLYETLNEKPREIEEVCTKEIEKISGFQIPLPDIQKFDILIGEMDG